MDRCVFLIDKSCVVLDPGWVWGVLCQSKQIKDLCCHNFSLDGGFKYFLISSLFGEMIQFDEHIFQMG